MSLNGAFSEMFTPQKRSASETSYFGGFSSFFSTGNGSFSAMPYKKALTLTAVFNAIEQISNDIAKIPFSVNRKVGNNRESQPNHPAHRLISYAPNSLMTTFIFRKTMAVSLLTRGNALAKIVYDSIGNPIETIFIDWGKVTNIRVKNGEKVFDVMGYGTLLASEVLHWMHFTLDGIVGVGPITYGAQQLGYAIEVQTYSATNFANKGVRQGVVESDKVINDTGKSSIVAGVKSAFSEKDPTRVTVLDEGMKWKAITITPQELQIIETAKFTVEEIARIFNIAPHKIKSLQQSTNNNIEQQSLDHVSDTIQPYITNIEQEYSKKFFTQKEIESGFYIRGNLAVLLRADSKARAEFYSRMVLSGIYNRNECRQLEDMNEGPALLSEFLTPVNTFTEEQIDKQIKENKDGNPAK